MLKGSERGGLKWGSSHVEVVGVEGQQKKKDDLVEKG